MAYSDFRHAPFNLSGDPTAFSIAHGTTRARASKLIVAEDTPVALVLEVPNSVRAVIVAEDAPVAFVLDEPEPIVVVAEDAPVGFVLEEVESDYYELPRRKVAQDTPVAFVLDEPNCDTGVFRASHVDSDKPVIPSLAAEKPPGTEIETAPSHPEPSAVGDDLDDDFCFTGLARVSRPPSNTSSRRNSQIVGGGDTTIVGSSERNFSDSLDTNVPVKRPPVKLLGGIVTIDDKMRTLLNGLPDWIGVHRVDERETIALKTLYYRHELWFPFHKWLLDYGYALPSRYRHKWKVPAGGAVLDEDDIELSWDSIIIQSATRIDDSVPVILKNYRMERLPVEHAILSKANYFTHSRDPSNHCMKVFQFLTDPNDPQNIIAVMPYLRKWNDPPPRTIGEALAMLAQLLEAIRWLHNQNIVWHDEECVIDDKILFGPPSLHSRRKYTPSRSHRNVKYYLVDFMRSREVDSTSGASAKAEKTEKSSNKQGSRKESPEKKTAQILEPFSYDLFNIGDFFNRNFFVRYCGFAPLRGLITSMKNKELNIDQALERLIEVRGTFSSLQLRSRLVYVTETFVERAVHSVPHALRTAGRVLSGVPASRKTMTELIIEGSVDPPEPAFGYAVPVLPEPGKEANGEAGADADAAEKPTVVQARLNALRSKVLDLVQVPVEGDGAISQELAVNEKPETEQVQQAAKAEPVAQEPPKPKRKPKKHKNKRKKHTRDYYSDEDDDLVEPLQGQQTTLNS